MSLPVRMCPYKDFPITIHCAPRVYIIVLQLSQQLVQFPVPLIQLILSYTLPPPLGYCESSTHATTTHIYHPLLHIQLYMYVRALYLLIRLWEQTHE
jgi:hypothetical protein